MLLCLSAALYRAVNRYEEVFQLMLKRAKYTEEDGDDEDGSPLPTDALLLQDLALTQLVDPEFAADVVRFVVLEARPWRAADADYPLAQAVAAAIATGTERGRALHAPGLASFLNLHIAPT